MQNHEDFISLKDGDRVKVFAIDFSDRPDLWEGQVTSPPPTPPHSLWSSFSAKGVARGAGGPPPPPRNPGVAKST